MQLLAGIARVAGDNRISEMCTSKLKTGRRIRSARLFVSDNSRSGHRLASIAIITMCLMTSHLTPTGFDNKWACVEAQHAWTRADTDGAPRRPPTAVMLVPGNDNLLRNAGRVDAIILPNENYVTNQTFGEQPEDFRNSYVIDHKRFVEPYAMRCFASTLLENPDSVEPNFVIIRAKSEVRVNATASLDTIYGAGFDPTKRTTLIVHGFTQSYPKTDWLRRTRALFEVHSIVDKQNLIIMDWGSASHGSYAQVAAMASGMGSFLANFIMKLIEMGADRRSIHIIGHSLGAHLAGFAGKRIRPHLGRITALDAAGPCFGKLFSNSKHDRLGPDDAYQVDVYHYDDTFLGLAAQLGQFDVYVNGGSSQPGAVDNMNAMMQAVITMLFRRNRVLSESHSRSTEVATSQLGVTGCQEVAYECADWPAFMSGECGHCDPDNSQCFFMGFHFQYPNLEPMPLRNSKQGKRLYIATGSNELYCLNHYQLLVEFRVAPELANQAKRNRWRLHVELVNERNERSNVTIIHQMAPNVFSYLLLTEMAPTKFKSALLQVRSGIDNSIVQLRDKDSPHKQPSRPYSQPYRVSSLQINFMSNINARTRRSFSSRLCPSSWLTSSESASFNSVADSSDDWLGLDECCD